ncbi:multicopper oxidase, type 1, CueO domain protein [Mycobacterium ulcerans str. Harvey]|uniref:Multicopper oxidase, type 1, CueO domain protein n=1 Tax=Mycobacterium ulcerans str. Harvey TaxID=1299332 RepID=A0ABN0QKU7_MYCUL|nr:multicopper oxidase, type 1, CueO domain protein [Mycobacterium ulcerans str. Harvey]
MAARGRAFTRADRNRWDALRRPAQRQHIFLASPTGRVHHQSGRAGRYRIYAEAYDQGHPGGSRPYLPLATLVVRGKPTDTPMAKTLVEPPRMPNLPVSRRGFWCSPAISAGGPVWESSSSSTVRR